jgi:hypothetical protein
MQESKDVLKDIRTKLQSGLYQKSRTLQFDDLLYAPFKKEEKPMIKNITEK